MDSSSSQSIRVVMCPPENFGEDAISPQGDAQPIDVEKAQDQWQALVNVLLGLDVDVEVLAPVEGLADQCFTANPVFAWPAGFFRANMRHESREPEVGALASGLAALGIKEIPLRGHTMQEGGGDLLWHNGRIWMGHGFRTDPMMLGAVREAVQVRVTPLKLVDPFYYHLDTCLCILDDKAALWIPEAFDEDSRDEIRDAFDLLIDVTDEGPLMAANAWSVDGEHIVIDGACKGTIEKLATAGFIPCPVDTSEFRKAGGSVYCLKQQIYGVKDA